MNLTGISFCEECEDLVEIMQKCLQRVNVRGLKRQNVLVTMTYLAGSNSRKAGRNLRDAFNDVLHIIGGILPATIFEYTHTAGHTIAGVEKRIRLIRFAILSLNAPKHEVRRVY